MTDSDGLKSQQPALEGVERPTRRMIRRLDRYLPLHASYYCVLVEIVNLCVDGAKIRRFSEHIER